jgi:uncharacterized membrane protein YoaK (UPF0700 family)
MPVPTGEPTAHPTRTRTGDGCARAWASRCRERRDVADDRTAPEATGADHEVVAVLLAAVAGSLDVLAFLALGQVFASVMTGNLALLGVAVGTTDGDLARSAGIAFAGYACGTAAGSLLTGGRRPRPARWALALESALLTVVVAGWEAESGEPTATLRPWLLLVAAAAMGVQSVAARRLPGGPSTTYFTGMLTGVVADLVQHRRVHAWSAARIASLVVAAGLAAGLDQNAPRLAVVLPGLALAAATFLAHVRRI